MLRFTNDIAIITENEEHLEKVIKTMNETFIKDLNIKINMQKTKILVYRKQWRVLSILK